MKTLYHDGLTGLLRRQRDGDVLHILKKTLSKQTVC